MQTHLSYLLLLVLIGGFMVGCSSAPPQTEASPTPSAPSITTPIDKATQTSKTVEQKAKEREQLNPEVQPSSTP